MRKCIFIMALMMGRSIFATPTPVDFVSTLVGTLSKHTLSTGNTYPAIALPWGMNFWTPQTGRMGDGWQYVYTEDKIRGLKLTHQPSPWINDYGQLSLMPETGELKWSEDDRASWFSHKAEVATPYYYKVYLADHDVTAEITPTERAAVFRFTYPESDCSRLIVDAFDHGSAISIDVNKNLIYGYSTRNSGGVPKNFKNYFVIQLGCQMQYWGIESDGKRMANLPKEGLVEGNHMIAMAGFPTTRGQQVEVRVASSFISLEQAMRNLQEVKGRSFDEVRNDARQRWNDVLGRIEVEDSDIDHLRTFYSCLYRCVLFPRSFYELDTNGQPVHYSPHTGEVCPGYFFTDTGFWDTFRSLFPLLNLVYPEMSEKMQEGLVNCYKESGFLPEWASPGHRGCMVGNNSASVVADAWLKLNSSRNEKLKPSSKLLHIQAPNLPRYDIETLWQAVVHGANAVHPLVSSTGRLGYDYYNRLGYVPYNVGINENVARTLEYAYDDWCIYQLGKALGKDELELKPFREHAMNYRNVFDKETKLMRGRNEEGTFQTPFSPLKWGDAFTEGNAWHYTWSVFHDPEGLIRLMGGKEAFVQMLDSVFNVPPLFDESYYGGVIHEIREMQIMNMGNYAHGNQPIQHMIYLYDWAAQPWKTQQRVREVMDRFYTAAPDGYCGDEDNGQTSAWYVFSAMGFYPVCPGSGQYAIGAPYFDKTTIHLPPVSVGGDMKSPTIVIEARNTDKTYIGSMTMNGRNYDRNYLEHSELTRGATIVCQMQETPNRNRGISDDALPYSFTFEE